MPLRSGLSDVEGAWSHKWGVLGVLGGVESTYLITWITTHLPTPEGWMAELAMLADRYRTAYTQGSHSSSYQSGTGWGKFADRDQRSNHYATPPTNVLWSGSLKKMFYIRFVYITQQFRYLLLMFCGADH